MIIIKFQDGTDWFKANWVFRQLAEDIMEAFPNDSALRQIMENAQALGGLFLNSMEPHVAASTLKAIKRVAEETSQGKIEGWNRTKPEDKDGQQMYLQSIKELLCLLENRAGGA